MSISTYGSYLLSSGCFRLNSGSQGNSHIYKLDYNAMNQQDKAISFLQDCVFDDRNLDELPISAPRKYIKSVAVKKSLFQPTSINPDSNSEVSRLAAIQAGKLHWFDTKTATNLATETVSNILQRSIKPAFQPSIFAINPH
jgi:hypothetical protein